MIENTEKLAKEILWQSLLIPSFTGSESKLANYYADLFKSNGFDVNIVKHTKNRWSVIAKYGNPKCAFCTHLDTAIEWEPPNKDEEGFYGIGACDAKGSLACQASIAILLSKLNKSVAVAFLAGEESDSIGARYLAENNILNVEFIIHGEPTEGIFIDRTASVLELKLKTKGEKGHSSCKNNEISAIHKLLKELDKIEKICNSNNFIFHIGNINGGGTLPSSFPEMSEALLQLRGYKKSKDILKEIKNVVSSNTIIDIIYMNDYCNFITLPQQKNKSVLFGSDAGILQNKYKQMLVGPGDIKRGHKKDEFITNTEINMGLQCFYDAYIFLNDRSKNE